MCLVFGFLFWPVSALDPWFLDLSVFCNWLYKLCFLNLGSPFILLHYWTDSSVPNSLPVTSTLSVDYLYCTVCWLLTLACLIQTAWIKAPIDIFGCNLFLCLVRDTFPLDGCGDGTRFCSTVLALKRSLPWPSEPGHRWPWATLLPSELRLGCRNPQNHTLHRHKERERTDTSTRVQH